ncbi:MAG: cyclase family protein [Magnetococcales bacterium]|nr:cyclase family protein [Magnetococcales bacterium]MBF0419446.1 cyclase family protein [Magnetococcales bacterium]
MGRSRWITLSHPLAAVVPVYGHTAATLVINPVKSLEAGDAANVFRITMENHWGTHVDTPAHFFAHGRSVADFGAGEWIFSAPTIVDVPAGAGEMIGVAALQAVDMTCDLVLLRTGFQRHRGQDVYSHDNPGVLAEVGLWLRNHRPRVRALGMDFVSLSARRDRSAGHASHRAFLDPDGSGQPVLLIEDMDLGYSLGDLVQVVVAPLLVRGIDSAPCTVFGRLEGQGGGEE